MNLSLMTILMITTLIRSTDRKTKFDFVKDVINDRGGGIRAEYLRTAQRRCIHTLPKSESRRSI